MILADKIIRLRKKNGWSQEELAEKMDVSRQAVAKWEGAQTVPNLEKILQLGTLFGVTIDYLLRDEIENEEFTDIDAASGVKRVTLAEANEFLEWRKSAAVRIAGATFLCILAVIQLLLFAGASEDGLLGISEDFAGVVGVVVLLIMVAVAVAIFILCDFQNAPYKFLEKDFFEVEYGVRGMVREKQEEYKNTYTKCNIAGTCLCILSPTPLLLSALFAKDDFSIIVMLTVTLFLAGIGVVIFIIAGDRWESMQKLLEEGKYTAEGKQNARIEDNVAGIYWLVATAIYLGWSFLTNEWGTTWVVWPVAGVLFAGVVRICTLIGERQNR